MSLLPSILSPLVESVSSSLLARNLAVSALTKRQLSTVLPPALTVPGFASKARMPGAETTVATGGCVSLVTAVAVIVTDGVLVTVVALAEVVGASIVGGGAPGLGVSVAVGVLVGCGVADVVVGVVVPVMVAAGVTLPVAVAVVVTVVVTWRAAPALMALTLSDVFTEKTFCFNFCPAALTCILGLLTGLAACAISGLNNTRPTRIMNKTTLGKGVRPKSRNIVALISL